MIWTLKMRKILKSEDGSGSGRVLVSEFILSKGKEVEESWVFQRHQRDPA